MVRIVKMTFDPDKTGQFLANFENVKEKIRAFEGIEYLHLLNDKTHSNVYFTYSIWESDEHLEKYRNSDLFKSIWSVTKPMFIKKAEAWSLESLVKM